MFISDTSDYLSIEQRTVVDRGKHHTLHSRYHPDHNFDPSESTSLQQALNGKVNIYLIVDYATFRVNFGVNYIKNRFHKFNFTTNYVNFDVIYIKIVL